VKVAVLEPLPIDNEVGLNTTVPTEELDSVTVRVPSVVTGLLNWSCRCTVIELDATPAATDTAALVNAILATTSGFTVKVGLLVTVNDGVTTVAVRDFPLPARVALRSLKVATPDESVVRGVVPLSVPPPFSVIFTDSPTLGLP
jgi:hypothetical protein